MNYNKGDRVGDYEIVDILGAGGMGRVYKVRNVISERVEAMKVLLPNLESDPDLADRFMREIKVQASLQHPNIACLHTALRVNNQLLMLIEFVEGATVEAELRHGRIPVAKAVEYVRQVLLALAYAHKNGVVHRDIKPANIMVMPDGTVKLMDFGIARLAADRKLTQTGRTVGSLFYMSPEQIQGATDLDGRSDLYSLGVTLYEMVTARRPFQGDSDYSIMAAHLSSRPQPPIEVDPALPQALNDVILMAIAKDPAQRFQTADAFRMALSSVAGAPAPSPVARPAAAPKPAPVAAPVAAPAAAAPPKSRRGLYMAIGSVATVAVLALAAMQAPKFFRSPSAAPPQPQQQRQIPAPATEPPPATTQPEPIAQQPQPEPAVQQARTQQQVAVQQPAPKPTQIAQRPAPIPVQQRPAPEPVAQPVPTTPAQPQQVFQQQQAQPTPQQPPPAQPVVDAAALNANRETLMLLGTRANSLKGSLDTMRQQQSRMGLNLRQDIATAEQRMEFYLDDAAAALKAGDAARAKKSLDSAERAIETIEKFLGR